MPLSHPRAAELTPPARMDANADIFKAILDDASFATDLQASYGKEVYAALTAAEPR